MVARRGVWWFVVVGLVAAAATSVLLVARFASVSEPVAPTAMRAMHSRGGPVRTAW